MKKLESLNNEKFGTTKQEIGNGAVVGGQEKNL